MDALENLKQVSEKYYEWKGKTREAAVDYLNSVLTEENPFVTFVDETAGCTACTVKAMVFSLI